MAKRSVPESYLAIAEVYPKWQRALAATRKAIADVETGHGDWQTIKRSKDRLYKIVGEAVGYVHSYHDPVIKALYAEVEALPSIEAAQKLGLEARERVRQAEIKRLREEEREAARPYAWIRR